MAETRRGFLKFLGIGAAAAPATLSATADRVIQGGMPIAPMGGYAGSGLIGSSPNVARPRIAREALKLMGVPQWQKDQWRHEAKNVSVLDPDLASMRSMSLSAKIYIQQDRNYQKHEAHFWKWWSLSDARQAWHKAFGEYDW